jgi:lipopolysaccharide biosynthesis protein
MIIPDIDDLVLEQDEEDGIEELGRRVLARGPWTTVAFLVRTRAVPEGPWEGPHLWLHRYQKVAQGWKLVSRFRTTEPDQLRALAGALADWDLGPVRNSRPDGSGGA